MKEFTSLVEKLRIGACTVCFFAPVIAAIGGEQTLVDFVRAVEWTAPHHAVGVCHTGEGLSFTVAGEDPWLLGPRVSLASNAAVRAMFSFSCAPTSCAGDWQLFWAFGRKGFSEMRSCRLFPVGKPPYTRFETPGPVPFQGKGRCRLRLDPPSADGDTFTVKRLAWEPLAPIWKFCPQTPPPLVMPAATPLVLQGDGWELRHDPDRMGAFRFISHGRIVENAPEEPFVYRDRRGVVRTLDWSTGAGAMQAEVRDGGRTLATVSRRADADGNIWRLARDFSFEDGGRSVRIRTAVLGETDGAVMQALHLPALTLFVDRSSGGKKRQAMLAGVEYLEDEPSSNQKEIRTAEHNRLIPSAHRLAAPLAVFTDAESWLAARWRTGGESAPPLSVVFDTPDRQFGSGGHLLAFWLPSVGSARAESELEVFAPQAVRTVSHEVTLRTGAGGTVADAIEATLFAEPPPEPDRIDLPGTLELLARGWLDSAIRDGVKVRHAVGGNFGASVVSDAPVLMRYLASALADAGEERARIAARLRAVADEMLAALPKEAVGLSGVSHVHHPAPVLVAGDVPSWLDMKRRELETCLRDLAEGRRLWKATGGKDDLGRTLGSDHCNGYSAMALDGMMAAASWSGDEDAIARALAIVDKATARYHGTVPRGAQPWEMPLHTPDIMASAHFVNIYTRAHLLRPDPAYLREARHWACTGLPMVYLDPAPSILSGGTGKEPPVGRYSTCAVMGATRWVAPNWIGRPVQWCGLCYSAALWGLARLEGDGVRGRFWRTIAEGITASGARQTHPASEPTLVGLLPDSWDLERQMRYAVPINPGTLQENVAELTDRPFYSLCAAAGGPSLFHVPGAAEALPSRGGSLRCRIAAWPEAPSRVVVTRTASPEGVLLDGRPIAFLHLPVHRATVVTVPARAAGVLEVRLDAKDSSR